MYTEPLTEQYNPKWKYWVIAASIVWASFMLTSCGGFMEQERAYEIKRWKHKERMLELEYINELCNTRRNYELQKSLYLLDSLEKHYRENY